MARAHLRLWSINMNGRWRYKHLPLDAQAKGKSIVDLLLESGKGYKLRGNTSKERSIIEKLRSELKSPNAPTQERNQYRDPSEPIQDLDRQKKACPI